MQQIPTTYPPFTFQSSLAYTPTLLEDPPAVRYNISSVDLKREHSIQPKDHSFKKRLQIFKQYKPRVNTVSENDDTVVYKMRRKVADSEQSKDVKPPAGQRQFSYGKQLNRYGSGDNLNEHNVKRRQKIFTNFKDIRAQKYQLSFQSLKESQEESMISTERFRKKVDTIIPIPQECEVQGFSLFSAKTANQSINILNNIYSRTPSMERLGSEGQVKISATPLSQKIEQIQPNIMISPKKITFTYQNYSSLPAIQQFPVPTASNPNQNVPQPFGTQMTNRVEPSSFPRSLVGRQATTYKESGFITNGRSNNQKKATYDFPQRQWNNRTKTIQTNKLSSWGNKIRTELMGGKNQIQEKCLRQKEFGSSKISLNHAKESMIINGEKIPRENLKINESFSNISDDQSSKRYFDEEIDFLPQVNKISYNNIDISREESFPENHQQFKPNQLLLQFQNQKFQTSKNEEILQIFDVSPVFKPAKKHQQPITEKNILQELSLQMKSEQLVKQVNKTGKLLPIMLVLFATMLFVIQACV